MFSTFKFACHGYLQKKAYSAHTIELMVALWLVTSYIATDIQFHVFNFQNLLALVIYKKKAYSAHTIELMVALWLVSSSLTSFFCVVPESPYSSDAASSSLLVAWYSNCFKCS